MTDCQVAVVGAGIVGSLVAASLADAGFSVMLIDRNSYPMAGSSRWNEGKIHLGYCYLGDATFATVNLMLDGAASFIGEIERLTGYKLEDDWFSQSFIYVVDPDTQFPIETLWQRSQKLATLIKERASVEAGLRRFSNDKLILNRLKPQSASDKTGLDRIEAAWETSELAVNPRLVASLIRKAVAEREIPLVNATARSIKGDGKIWCVETDDRQIRSLAVVNATWESRLFLDQGVRGGIEPCSIRFKHAIFGRDLRAIVNLAPSTRILGPFGDVTPYRNGESYLSWYPSGMIGLSNNGVPPTVASGDTEQLAQKMLDGLGLDHGILASDTGSWSLGGGYVVAHGHGDIDHPASPLHARSRPDVFRLAPGYFSVDTGKYSLGPLMARRATNLIKSHFGVTRV